MTTISNLATLEEAGLAVPEYVRKDEAEPVRKIARTNLSTFTKRSAYLSAVELLLNAEAYPDRYVKQAVDQGVAFWGIGGDVAAAERALAGATPKYTKFAMEIKDGDTVLERRFPLDGGSELRCQAASDLFRDRNRYPLSYVKSAAETILADGPLGDAATVALERMALRGKAASTAEILRHIETRYSKAGEVVAEQLGKMASLLDEQASEDVCGKLAMLMDEADRVTGRCRDYHALARPEDICCYGVRSKLAAIEAEESEIPELEAPAVEVREIPVTKFAALGDAFVEAIDDGTGMVDPVKLAACAGKASRKHKKMIKAVVAGEPRV